MRTGGWWRLRKLKHSFSSFFFILHCLGLLVGLVAKVSQKQKNIFSSSSASRTVVVKPWISRHGKYTMSNLQGNKNKRSDVTVIGFATTRVRVMLSTEFFYNFIKNRRRIISIINSIKNFFFIIIYWYRKFYMLGHSNRLLVKEIQLM